MKRLILCVSLVLSTVFVEASVLSIRSRLALPNTNNLESTDNNIRHYNINNVRARGYEAPEIEYYPMLLSFHGNEGLDFIRSLGGIIYYTREDMALCSLPCDRIGELDDERFIREAEVMGSAMPTLDRSRAFTGVDAVQQGINGSIVGYDGTGVVTGFCDIGFDPDHIAFKGRVPMMSVYRDYNGLRSVYAPGTSLHTGGVLQPERDDELHATHVANIMAGGYKGNGYYGAAPSADIVATVSETSTMGLLCGIEDVIAYAKEVGKPAVVNLSMSSQVGPHDGTDITNRYLDLLGKEAIIVFSAGNSGNSRQTYSHTFSDSQPTVTTYLDALSWRGFNVHGNVDIWSDDATPLKLCIVACDKETHEVVYKSEWIDPTIDDAETGARLFCDEDEEWSKMFPADNYINVSWGVDASNRRFCYAMNAYVNPTEQMDYNGTPLSRYNLGFMVSGPSGAHINIFGGSGLAFMDYTAGSVHGNADFSINNMCCNANTISVGSWNTRNTIPMLGGEPHVFGFQENSHTFFSSYATMPNGRRLPDICAPGNYVVSALSSAYMNNTEVPHYPWTGLSETVDGVTYYWGGQCGTSMAAPMAAGVFALWLQADPTLDVQSIREIAQATARRNFDDIADDHWGASGALDAAAGLRMVVDRAGIEYVENPLIVTINHDNTLLVTLGIEPVSFLTYNMQGQCVDGNKPLSSGIYVVKVGKYVKKIAISA